MHHSWRSGALPTNGGDGNCINKKEKQLGMGNRKEMYSRREGTTGFQPFCESPCTPPPNANDEDEEIPLILQNVEI